MNLSLLAIVISALLSWKICEVLRAHLIKAARLDQPNARSMHSIPVPRGGGLGLWLAVFPVWGFALSVLMVSAPFDIKPFMVMLGVVLLILVSWADDKKPLSPLIRFSIHIAAVLLGLYSFNSDQLVVQGLLPLWLDRLVTALAWLWFINLTNFMDGIDGITAIETAHISLGFIAVSQLSHLHSPNAAFIAPCLLGAALGFLFWNWHKAKLFLGDVGSIPLGYLLGYLLIVLAISGHLGIALTLPLYYLADATFTLFSRIFARKKFWQGHREHFYQQAALAVGRHDSVVWCVIGCNAGLFFLSVLSLDTSPWLLCAAPLLVWGLLWYLKRLSRNNCD